MIITKFVYKGNIVGEGKFYQLPRTGDFFKVNCDIYKIEAVMFSNGPDGFMFAVLYLKDGMSETEEKLKHC